jgi:hypothetical protein
MPGDEPANIPDPPSDSAPVEQRADPRRPCRLCHFCRVLVRPSFQTHYALLDSVAARGVGLILPFRLDSGAVLAVQLPSVRPGMSCIQSARVVHVQEHEGGGWLHGCSLGRPLSPEELDALA